MTSLNFSGLGTPSPVLPSLSSGTASTQPFTFGAPTQAPAPAPTAPLNNFSLNNGQLTMNPTTPQASGTTSGATTQAAAQPSQAQLQNIQNQIDQARQMIQGMATNGLPKVGASAPQNFNVPPVSNTVDSNYISPGQAQDNLMLARAQKQADMQSGTNPDLIPSDTLQGKLANQLYQSSLYSPAEQSLIQNQQDLAQQVSYDTLAAKRQIAALQQSGQITKEQAAPMLQDIQDRANARLADLNYNSSQNTAQLTALGLIRQNNISALQNVLGELKGQEVAPGSTLFNPITGTQYQGMGASQPQIMATAQSLAQLATQQGTVALNSDGSINMQPYIDQAKQFYGGGSIGQATTGGGASTDMIGSTGQTAGTVIPGTESAPQLLSYSYGVQKGLPPTIAGAVIQSQATGDYYISGSRVPTALQGQASTQGAMKGIGYVPPENVGNIQQLDVAIGQLQQLNTMAEQYLSPGLMGRLKGLTTNQVKTFLQSDPGWAQFTSTRLQAIDYLKGLAQGGGFRTTESEINTAANSLLSTSDNLESAKAKMEIAMRNINLAYKEYLPTHKDTPLTGGSVSTGTTPSGGQVVQTKVGPIDNSWFN